MVETTLNNTIGALLIGTICAAILFGVNSLQSYVYFTTFPEDSRFLKLMVSSLWSIDFLHLVLIVRTVYFYCISSFSDPSALTQSTWELIAQILVTIVSDTIVRFFFIWRIHTMSKRVLMPILMLALSMTCFVASVVYTAEAYKIKLLSEVRHIQDIFYIVYSSAVAVDLLITGVLVFQLGGMKIGVKRPDSILKSLSLYTVNTGVLTCLSHIAILLTFIFMPDNLIYAGIYVCSSKWLMGSFLATLNAREKLRKRSGSGQTFQLSTVAWNNERAGSGDEGNFNIGSMLPVRFRHTIDSNLDMDIDIGNIKIYDDIQMTEAQAHHDDRAIEIGPAINSRVTPEPSEPSPADSEAPLRGNRSDLDGHSYADTRSHTSTTLNGIFV